MECFKFLFFYIFIMAWDLGDCVSCGKKTQKFCDGCGAYVCENHFHKPFANKEIILCNNCWENRDIVLEKIKKRSLNNDENIVPEIPDFQEYP